MATERHKRSGSNGNSTLLWERLRLSAVDSSDAGRKKASGSSSVQKRLPYDGGCVATTRSGRRCRCRARLGTDFCAFHDPSITRETRRAKARKAAQTRRAKPVLPKGYPRRLTTPEAVRAALERLYVETRAGQVTPQEAQALLQIIHAINASAPRSVVGQADKSPASPHAPKRQPATPLEAKAEARGSVLFAPVGQLRVVVQPGSQPAKHTVPRPRRAVGGHRFGSNN